MSLIQVLSLSLSLNLHMVVFRTQILTTFLETNRDFAKRVPLIVLEESLQGIEELELNVEVILFPRIVDPVRGIPVSSIENNRKCWVEKCGVQLIMEKSKADSDIHGEKWDHEIDLHALGSSTTDDQRLESSLIRELQKLKIIRLKNHLTTF
ncbi:hypothetical protein DKX38_028862 [Salix brachista]|uniref:Uncharacterized protein n=1 Tax=Salix brachista TaxID=2182728 RepID=A0A5N5J297_9ROSI|nr:hypothetical protein DKX38_028862 [Salix brachista]